MEVAEQIQISQAQVSRLEKNALKIMKTISVGLKAVILPVTKFQRKLHKNDFTVEISRTSYYDKHVE